MKTATKKQIVITEGDKAEFKNVKVWKVVHRELKRYLIDNDDSISEFVSQAIIEKLAK